MENDKTRKLQEDLNKCRAQIDQLKSSEKEYRNLFHFMGEGFMRADAEGKIVMANNVALQITGYDTVDELIGMPMVDLYVNPEDREEFVKKLKSKKIIRNMEFLLRQKNNTLIWTLCTIQLRFSNDGEVIGTEGIFRNIHERKQAQSALKERVKELSGLYEISKIVDDSEKDLETIIKEIVKVIPPAWQFPEICEAKIEYSGNTVQTENYKTSIAKLEEEIKSFNHSIGEITVVYLDSISGKPQATFLPEERNLLKMMAERIGKLIERKYAEEKLKQEKEEKYYRLTENLPNDIVYVFSKQKGTKYFSDRIFSILKFSKEQIENNPFLWNEAIHEQDRKRVNDKLASIKEGETFNFEYRIHDANGEIHWFQDRAFNIYKQNQDIIIEGIASDITQRKIAEKKLEESEKKYKTLYENAPLAYQSLNISGKILDVNPAWLSTLGYTKEEVVGQPFSFFLHHQWKPHFEKNFPEFKRRGYVNDVQFRMKHKNGLYIDVSFQGRIGFNPDGSFKQTYCVFQDITEKKKAEEALRESEEAFKLAIENIPYAVFAHNLDGEFVILNKTSSDYTGYTREELMKMKVNNIDKGSISRKDRENIWEKLRYGDSDTFQAEHHRKDGSTYPVEISITAITLQNEHILLAVVQDITERLQIENELKASEEKYRHLAENMIDMVARHQADGAYSYVSPSVKTILGYTPDELIGMDPYELFHTEDKKRIKEESHAMAMKGEVINSIEYRIKNKTGDYIWFNTNIKYIYENKDLVALQTVSRDITEQKKAQKLKNELIIAQQSARLKEKFLANMSHEMRTPMNGIIGMTGFLSETKLNNNQKEFVETIKESSESLLQIINDVLNLSKIEQGMVELEEENVRISGIFTHTINLFKAEAKRKNIRISYHANDELPTNVILDKQNFRQVLYNLMSNALKYTHEGEIKINMQLVEKKKQQFIGKVSIEDTGIGIDEEDRQRIFDPFVRLDDELTKTTEGTGLGLTIAKNLVEIMGGEMGVESKPQQGSKFWFTFQSSIGREEISKESNPVKKDAIKLHAHILIAEDKLLNQKVAGILKNMGCTYEIAENGEKVLELFEENKFDIILMDIMMPEMDGIEAMKQLRANYKKVPPIIGLSAQALEGDAKKYMDKGMDDYLEKPINKNKLAEKLVKWGVSASPDK